MAKNVLKSSLANRRKPSLARWHWLFLLTLLALLAWIFWPVTRGDFVADDYVFLATGRMVDAPLAAFWQSHFYEPYYFRPIGVISWWIATRLFGLDYAAHSLINLLLQGANALLLFLLLRALTLRTSAAFAGAALAALGPFGLAASLWPSNRFDLLAVGFLLIQALAMVHAVRGSRLATALAAVAALAACWSKELAYPVATVLACAALFANNVTWRYKLQLFALLGAAIGSAFFVRLILLPDALSLAGSDPIAQIVGGAEVMISSLPKLAALILGADLAPWFGYGMIALIGVLAASGRAESRKLGRLLTLACVVLIAVFVAQTPLAKAFNTMLDGSPFGTVTYARFYYAPWVAACVMISLLLARSRFETLVSIALIGLAVLGGITERPLAAAFANWTLTDVRPMSVAATGVADTAASAVDTAAGSPCVFVFLGTQTAHPYFRMFSDVTVKARTSKPQATWRCQVMTESTPWLFAFPLVVQPASVGLREIPGVGGVAKPDSIWSSIRYRYRLPVEDFASLPSARFFDWHDGAFVEVTEKIHRGERKVTPRDW